ncbi:amidohydrolase family protein [Kordiimonas sp. SCSIO 12603]|uniref:N-acyl-D-amino-acid deacylase family protein n=1 Tax=Kordiimonas sp. SCSIO 12603 TaxID=2829596 RepID=UPI002107290A|nr:amidohydrolase family protein [Kordiimonas sp. SCSIO 12603]UTW58778.1 amidohydrolase family protein [Kordiimonas sp. SCSIO 12603]
MMNKQLLLLVGLLFFTACGEKPNEKISADYLIKDGLVYVGDMSRAKLQDVAIKGDKIVFVGLNGNQHVTAGEVINASGMIVSPGFIDIHTHALEELPDTGPVLHENFLTQGVTTIFSGNDGRGPFNIESAFSDLVERGVTTNIALFVGHGTVRRAVMGDADRAPTADELEAMKALVEEAMKGGALGISTGLYYAPGSFSDTDEVIELAKVAARYGGVYESHIRDESSYNIGLLGAVKETLEIGRKANIPVHFAHIKALGVDVWGQSKDIVALVEEAQKNGQRVTADQYPWKASGTRISNALVPRWAMAGGKEKLFARLKNAENNLEQIKDDIHENLRKRGGPDAVLITGKQADYIGKTLRDYAEANKLTFVDAVIDIVLKGDAGIASFNMHDEDVERLMSQSWVLTGSDAGDGHPRKSASFPEKYQTYVKAKNTLTMSEFIHRSTGLTADTFGIKNRGYLKSGFYADIVILHPDRYRGQASYSNPHVLSEGVEYLFINGQEAITEGQFTEKRAGKPLPLR